MHLLIFVVGLVGPSTGLRPSKDESKCDQSTGAEKQLPHQVLVVSFVRARLRGLLPLLEELVIFGSLLEAFEPVTEATTLFERLPIRILLEPLLVEATSLLELLPWTISLLLLLLLLILLPLLELGLTLSGLALHTLSHPLRGLPGLVGAALGLSLNHLRVEATPPLLVLRLLR